MDTELATIAEVYAESLLDLATSRGEAALIDQELGEFAAYLKIDPDFRAFYTSRVVDPDDRRESLDKIFQGHMNDLLLNTLHILNEKDRTIIISELQRVYHLLHMEQEGIVDVRITTAEPLSDALKVRLQQMLETRVGKKVNLIEQVDPQMLGGLILRIGDERVDMSISHQLDRFHQLMVDHASRHIHAGTNFFEEAQKF